MQLTDWWEMAGSGGLAVLLVCTLCGLLSPLVVLKSRSYLGDALAHMVFPGVVAGYLVSQTSDTPLWVGVVSGAGLAALAGAHLLEGLLRSPRVPSDAATVVCLGGFLAAGSLLASSAESISIDLEGILFGDLLALGPGDLWILAGAVALSGGLLWSLRQDWDAWVCDAEFALLAGYRTRLLARLFPLLLTTGILCGLFAVGSLMITALLAVPALLVRPPSVFSLPAVACSVSVGAAGFGLGLALNLPVGATIVALGAASVFVSARLRRT